MFFMLVVWLNRNWCGVVWLVWVVVLVGVVKICLFMFSVLIIVIILLLLVMIWLVLVILMLVLLLECILVGSIVFWLCMVGILVLVMCC